MPRPSFKAELAEGVRWLMGHSLLRPMAIILGLMNLAGMVTGATMVLFAQEVLDIGPLLFSILGFGAAAGGIVGGTVAPWASKRFGSGTCLAVVLGGSAVMSTVVGVLPFWPVVMFVFGVEVLLGTLWNVITVSLRQTIIPSHLLGPRQQRVPLLRVGDDADRRRGGRRDRGGGRRVRRPRQGAARHLVRQRRRSISGCSCSAARGSPPTKIESARASAPPTSPAGAS